ncbi:autophagy 18 F-like protein isoform X2 [Wolffia australiana]
MKKPPPTKFSEDRFADVRPLLAIAGDGFPSGGTNSYDGALNNGHTGHSPEMIDDNIISTTIHFYSLKTHTYVHVLKFRSAIYTIRSGPRVVAVSQANQIHCFDATTLEREYTILTHPLVAECFGSGGIGYGPLAVGTRWLAYSGSPVVASNSGRVAPEILSPVLSTSPNGSLVAHYAMESSKQLAAGFKTLGDIGYKKLSKYCTELLPDGNGLRQGNSSLRKNGTGSGQSLDDETAGMVIVRDLVSKVVIVQFRAHKSPISALTFDPSGILLVTASVHGHNINVFRVIPSVSGDKSRSVDASGSYTHLYRLQRGFTNAVIQDISFSNDSQWIMVSTSRGTSHLFSISSGISANPPSNDAAANGSKSGLNWPTVSSSSTMNRHILLFRGPPLTLSAVSRIRNGNNGLMGVVSGAAAAATGRPGLLAGTVASAFHNCNRSFGSHQNTKKYNLLVFSPSGCVMQYVLRPLTGADSMVDTFSGSVPISHEPENGSDASLLIEAVRKWDICHKKKRRDQGEIADVNEEQRIGESGKHFQKGMRRSPSIYPADPDAVSNLKFTMDEKRHLYISEFELITHDSVIPLWAKSEIYFQAMIEEGIKTGLGNSPDGELELERMPTRTIEARSKDLIPVFDYLQLPSKPPKLRPDGSGEGCRGRFCSPELAEVADQLMALDDHLASGATHEEGLLNEVGCYVDNSNGSEVGALLELVDNGDGPEMNSGRQLEPVNIDRESPNMVKYFADDDNEID